MSIKNREEYVAKKLSERGINKETQEYVQKYISANQHLFGNIIDMDTLVDRIANNLHHSIGRTPIFFPGAYWNSYTHRIRINPLLNLKVLKNFKSSITMHELDHCATTEYKNSNGKKRPQYVRDSRL